MSSICNRLDPLISPQSIAVIGASTDSSRIGGRPLLLARQFGFDGQVCGVNPKYNEVLGFPCYSHISSIPYVPDLAIVAVGAAAVLETLQACVDKGIRAAVVFAGGFAETGTPQGRQLQKDITILCRKTGLLVAGPNGIGLVNVLANCYATFMSAVLDAPPKPGGVALVAQSGGACIAVHNHLQARGVGENYILNTGNEASISFTDYIDYVANDPSTQVVAGYIEGLDGSPAFASQMLALREKNIPVVLYKVGETAEGADAAASHTARMAGSQQVFKTALRQLGVMHAHDMEQLAELSYLSQFSNRHMGLKVGILTTSGAFAAILTDKFVADGLTVPKLSDQSQALIRPHVPAIATIANPVDITANVVNSPDGFEEALSTMLAIDELDFVVFFSTANLIDLLAPQMISSANKSSKLFCVMVTGQNVSTTKLEAAGIPVFTDTGRGASALATMAHWNADKKKWAHWPASTAPQTPRLGRAQSLLQEARSSRTGNVDEQIGKQLLALYSIPVPLEDRASDPQQARRIAQTIGYPVVLKVLSADIVHKSDVGGVKVGISNDQQLQTAYADILTSTTQQCPNAKIDAILVQQQVDSGIELLISCLVDPLFGPVLTVGAGGVLAELVGDVAQRVLPISKTEARQLLNELKIYPLLEGYRGEASVDLDGLTEVLVCISALGLELANDISEIEINPLIVKPGVTTNGSIAVDCVIKMR